MRRLIVLIVVLTTGLAWATEVGRFAFVQKEVNSFKPSVTEPVQAKAGDAVVVGEREVTGAASGAKLLFGEGGVVSLGANTSFAVSQLAVDQATGKNTSSLSVLFGKARVFLSRFWSDRPEVKIDQPTAVVGIKGTEVGLEQFRDGRLTITCYGGTAGVLTKATPPQTFELREGMQLKLDASGKPVGPPSTLSAAELDALRNSVDIIADGAGGGVSGGQRAMAAPSPSDIASQFSGLGSTAGRAAVNTSSNSANGGAWSDPAGTLLPPPVDSGCNCDQGGRGN
ncbi:MAG: FecR domain-containing protein [Acidobacteriota bacterium]